MKTYNISESLPTKQDYLKLLDEIDFEVPDQFAGMVLSKDQIAGAFLTSKVPQSEIKSRALKIVEDSITKLQAAFDKAKRETLEQPPLPVRDAQDRNSLTPEEAKAELARLISDKESAYWNPNNKYSNLEQERAMAFANRLRAITAGQETSLTGYVQDLDIEREDRYAKTYGPRESKSSSTGPRRLNIELSREGSPAEGGD